jgi:TonB family protein
MLQLILALAAAPAGHVVVNPDWAATPDGRELSRSYPAMAAALGIEGHVVITCMVNVDGSTRDCRVVSEDPPNLEFGKAALAVAAHFKFRPMTLDGQPVPDGVVKIPLKFAAPEITRNDVALAERCAGWAQATLDAMAPPAPMEARWPYLYWRFQYSVVGIRTGLKPSEMAQRVKTAAENAAPHRTDGDRYRDCLTIPMSSVPTLKKN